MPHARPRVRAALLGLATLLCSLFVLAPAAQAAEASLEGSLLGAEPGSSFRPGTITTQSVCNPFDGSGTVHFRAEGVVVNDNNFRTTSYPGTYVEEGTFVVSGTPLSPGSVVRTLSSWDSTFTIRSGDKRVTGSRSLPPGATSQGHCGPLVLGSTTWPNYILGFGRTRYTAEIHDSAGTLLGRDAGRSDSEVQDAKDTAGEGNLMHRDRDYDSQDADRDGVIDDADNCPAESNHGQADADGDGHGDVCDTDRDGDSVANDADNCADVSNADQANNDGDAEGDVCDSDDDNDTVADGSDNCQTVANTDQNDLDGDDRGDACDSDRDGDGAENGADNCADIANADQANLDGDAEGDACDSDRDGDQVANDTDNCADLANADQKNLDGDAEGDACDSDRDGDNVANATDNCADVANADQDDLDGDGLGDACDSDRDGDGAENGGDNCADVANAGQDDLDGDGLGDACDTDRDGDEVANGVDNCADVPNDQLDTDADGQGNACDADDDNDSFADAQDNCPLVASASQRDSDSDGVGDDCDNVFDSRDGMTTGGGWYAGSAGKVHLSFSAVSKAGRITGIGELREGATRVRLVSADGYTQADGRSITVGDAVVGASKVRYRLETADGGKIDTFELEVDGQQPWAGTLDGGNLDVKR